MARKKSKPLGRKQMKKTRGGSSLSEPSVLGMVRGSNVVSAVGTTAQMTSNLVRKIGDTSNTITGNLK